MTDGWLGKVRAFAFNDTAAFVGGDFTALGLNTGQCALVDHTTGEVLPGYENRKAWSGTTPSVHEFVGDGNGGYFIGGWFERINTIPHTYIAHFDQDGLPTGWTLDISSGYVGALARSGDTLFIGGYFSEINGQPRQNIAAVDIPSGQLLAWNPGCNGQVGDLICSNGTVLVAGGFTTLGGMPRAHIGIVDQLSGIPISIAIDADTSVWDITLLGDTLFLLGDFSAINGTPRDQFAALDVVSGNLLPLSFSFSGFYGPTDLTVLHDTLLMIGAFTHVNGQAHSRMCRVSRITGNVDPWDPGLSGLINGGFHLLATADVIYIAGQFDSIVGQARFGFAAFDRSTWQLLPWDPHGRRGGGIGLVNDSTLLVMDGLEYGLFGRSERRALAMLDSETAALLPFDVPVVGSVRALAIAGDTLFIGGAIDSIGGVPRANLGALLISSGQVLPWTPDPSGTVKDLIVHDGKLFVGGAFNTISGSSQRRVVSYNLPNLTLDPWTPFVAGDNAIVEFLEVYGGRLFVGGDVNESNGTLRHGMAAFQLPGGALLPWDPVLDYETYALAGWNGRAVLAGDFYTVNGTPRKSLAMVDTINGATLPWVPDPTLDANTAYDLFVRDSVLFVCGSLSMDFPSAQSGFAALNLSSGSRYLTGPSVPSSKMGWSDHIILVAGNGLNGDLCTNLITLNGPCLLPTLDNVQNATCAGAGIDGSAMVSVFGGVSPYAFLWNSTPPQFTSTMNGVGPGLYTLTIQDSDTCSAQVFVPINGPSYVSDADLWSMLTTTGFRPGGISHLWACIGNNGCLPADGTLSVVLDDLVSFVQAVPPPSFITGDTLVWSINDLTYDSASVCVVVDVITDTTAMVGDTVCFHVLADATLIDIDPANDAGSQCIEVVASFDPNMKQVVPQGVGPEGAVPPNQEFQYTIHFQNTGTAEAINVGILDTLSSQLDMMTFQAIASSHPMILSALPPGNVIRFDFLGINLPDSTSDEPNSHGFVTYRVRPHVGLSDGTVIQNTARIYFDYNYPIVTNTVSNMIDIAMGIHPGTIVNNATIQLQPNPASEQTLVTVPDALVGQRYSLMEASGREILSGNVPAGAFTIDVGALAAGYYSLRINEQVARLVKR